MHTELPGIRSLIQRAFERIKPRYKLVLGVSIFPMLACVILFAIFLIPLTERLIQGIVGERRY